MLAAYIADLMGVSLALADMQIALGQTHEAKRTFEFALKQAAPYPALRGTADMYVGLADLCAEANDLERAAEHLRVAMELGESAGLPQHQYRWRVATARLRAAEGDLDAALELLNQAEAVYNTDFSPPIKPIAAMKARVQLAQGDVESARRWASERGLRPDDELTYVREYEHITLARLLLAERSDEAEALLRRLLEAAERGHRAGSVIELRSLLDGGPVPPTTPRRRGGLVEELSARELDVLRLLRSELGGPEIARELHVSLNTVRTHTKNIYSKLGATNRREAIRRAAELGL